MAISEDMKRIVEEYRKLKLKLRELDQTLPCVRDNPERRIGMVCCDKHREWSFDFSVLLQEATEVFPEASSKWKLFCYAWWKQTVGGELAEKLLAEGVIN